MIHRIIHWGTGATGALGLSAILDRADFELVGLHVRNPAKAGKDAAEFVGREPVGITATTDFDALLESGADCVTYLANGSGRSAEVAQQIAAFLERGVNVVTTSLPEAMNAATCPPAMRDVLLAACRKGRASLFSTGIDPGFATSHLPLACYSIAHHVERVHLQEFAGYGTYPDEPTLREYFGFGKPMDHVSPVASGELLRNVWTPTVAENARALGFAIDAYRTTFTASPAHKDLETAVGRIEKGSISAMWFQLIGMAGAEDKVILEHVNWMHADDVPKDWPQPVQYQGTLSPVGYRLSVKGTPSFDCELQLPENQHGRWVTALHAVNAIPFVCAAPPGIVTQADIARIAGIAPKFKHREELA